MNFHNFFVKRKIQTIQREALPRKSRFCSLLEAKAFFISFNIGDREKVLECIERLNELKKDVFVSVVIPQRRNNRKAVYEVEPSWLLIKEDELDMRGFPSKDICTAFNNIQADVLIDLTREDDYVMHYLQLLHPALFKVGNKSSLRNLFDFTVTMGDGDAIPDFFEHVLFYLRTIRSN